MIALPARQLVRWRGWVIGAWALLALLFVPKAAHVQRVLAVRGMNVEATESARAAQLIREAFPNPIAEYVAIVVHGPVRYTPASTSDVNRTVVPDLRETVQRTLERLPHADGFDVKVTGNPALDYDVRTISAEDTRRAEEHALPLTLAVLVLAFGALVAATLPIIVGVLAITIALGIVAVAAQFQTMSVFVLNITTMVGLGVGIDYSLLIVTRFREELNRGLSPVDAAIRTIQTAGSAVVTSGLTVVVGFAALILTPLTETRSVGVGGLIVVAVAVLLATTFLPAALAMLGRDIDRPKWLARMLAWIHTPQGWERWSRYLGHRPWRAILGGGLAPTGRRVGTGTRRAARDGRERCDPAAPCGGGASARRIRIVGPPAAGPQGPERLDRERPARA